MIGFCDLLLLRHAPGEQSFSDIMQIQQNANRAAGLVRQLLAFSRRQTLQPEVIDLTESLADVASVQETGAKALAGYKAQVDGQIATLSKSVENLTALTLRLNPDTRRTPGVYHAVLKKLAWEKVSVVNLMCTYTELTLLLDPCQTAGAYSVLSQIVSH